MKEDTKASRATKVKEEMMELTDARVKLVSLGFPAVKVLQDLTASRERMGRRETLVRSD